ncbi:hypothetical protein H1230_18835 [Paenibacillus sp. 19GGS1-52]|uniref:hypothetical protein n=1 Tax=Paenibacillus sp. 19GGS1-52 TaxID=2758563 RepID=UPI001EFB717A|nr:hypothetical protein [Paenibacillus sp. 19GGS1-52]ULO05166.1 hypothetical protein H1230_18835 [Paenibacillus sp. 19GGS1-52]
MESSGTSPQVGKTAFTKTRVQLEQKHFPQGVTPDMIWLLDDIEELLVKAHQVGCQTAERLVPQAWSNQSAFGYAILSAERAGLDAGNINRLVRSMHNRLDMITLDEAAEAYRKSSY